MTTLSLKLNLPDQTAQDLERISQLAGRTESEFRSEAVVRLIEQIRTFYKVEMDVQDLKEIQEELRPYREASPYKSEEDFLNRKA